MFKVKKLKDHATVPQRATEQSYCYDICAAIKEGDKIATYYDNGHKIDVTAKTHEGKTGFWLEAQARALIPTGLQFVIPDGYGVLIFPRSGLALKQGLSLINCVGVIDADYSHEVGITLLNTTRVRQFIETGTRLCQAALMKREGEHMELELCDAETDAQDVAAVADNSKSRGKRRNGGFGSTGTQVEQSSEGE